MMSEYEMVGTISPALKLDSTSSVPKILEKPIDLKVSLESLSTRKYIPRYSIVRTIPHSAPPLFLAVSEQFEEDAPGS